LRAESRFLAPRRGSLLAPSSRRVECGLECKAGVDPSNFSRLSTAGDLVQSDRSQSGQRSARSSGPDSTEKLEVIGPAFARLVQCFRAALSNGAPPEYQRSRTVEGPPLGLSRCLWQTSAAFGAGIEGNGFSRRPLGAAAGAGWCTIGVALGASVFIGYPCARQGFFLALQPWLLGLIPESRRAHPTQQGDVCRCRSRCSTPTSAVCLTTAWYLRGGFRTVSTAAGAASSFGSGSTGASLVGGSAGGCLFARRRVLLRRLRRGTPLPVAATVCIRQLFDITQMSPSPGMIPRNNEAMKPQPKTSQISKSDGQGDTAPHRCNRACIALFASISSYPSLVRHSDDLLCVLEVIHLLWRGTRILFDSSAASFFGLFNQLSRTRGP